MGTHHSKPINSLHIFVSRAWDHGWHINKQHARVDVSLVLKVKTWRKYQGVNYDIGGLSSHVN